MKKLSLTLVICIALQGCTHFASGLSVIGPLTDAAIDGDLAKVKSIYEQGGYTAEDLQTALKGAIYSDSFEIVTYLVGKGSEINTPFACNAINGSCRASAFNYAAGSQLSYGSIEMVRHLFMLGGNPDGMYRSRTIKEYNPDYPWAKWQSERNKIASDKKRARQQIAAQKGRMKKENQKAKYQKLFEQGRLNNTTPYKGELTNLRNTRYIGTFINGKLDGYGQIILANGDSYKGSFKAGKHVGVGVLTEGSLDYLKGRRKGELIYQAPGPLQVAKAKASNNCRVNHSQHGEFILVKGGCDNTKITSDAILVTADSKYLIEGKFTDGKLVVGTLSNANSGVVYRGEWVQKNNGINYQGKGSLYGNGSNVYQGAFNVSGQRHGKGYCLYQSIMEPCEYANNSRVDELHKMRLERAKIQQWEISCNASQNQISRDIDNLSRASNSFCVSEYEEIDKTVKWVFSNSDTMYYSNSRPWIERKVDVASKCRKNKLNQIRNQSSAIHNTENALQQSQCPGSLLVSDYRQLRNEIVSDAERQADNLSSMEAEYLQMEREARAQADRRTEQERAQMWNDVLNKFESNMRSISSEMTQIRSQTSSLIKQANVDADRRRIEHHRLQQKADQARAKKTQTGYAGEQKSKLTALNAKISAKNKSAEQHAKAFDAKKAKEREDCVKQGHEWSYKRNVCDTTVNVKLAGFAYSCGSPVVTEAPGMKCDNTKSTSQSTTNIGAGTGSAANGKSISNTSKSSTGGAEATKKSKKGPVMQEELAYCYFEEGKHWYCHGSLMQTNLGKKDVLKAVRASGCKRGVRYETFSKGRIYFCEHGRRADRKPDIASLYSVPENILRLRNRYQCDRFQQALCVTKI